MKSKTTRHGLKRMTALLLAVVLCVGMVPTAFAAQQDSYHDPAENWQEANNRTNELDANATVTHETFNCKVCKQQTSFIVFRTPEYTRDGQTAMSRNVKYSDGTFVDGSGKGSILDGVPGQDAYYTAYHWTKAVCETCGSINTNMAKTDYGYLKNVYWLYDCANNFFEELPETQTIEQADSEYHRVITTSGEYCGFCYGTFKEENSRWSVTTWRMPSGPSWPMTALWRWIPAPTAAMLKLPTPPPRPSLRTTSAWWTASPTPSPCRTCPRPA